MKPTIAIPFVAALAAAATPAGATEFAFTSGKNPVSWTADGITLAVSGWSTISMLRTATPNRGTAVAYTNYGYGVINSHVDTSHTIDNWGWYDFIRLDFSKPVTLDSVTLAPFGDTDSWISFGDEATNMLSTAGWATFLDNGANYLDNKADRSFNVGNTTAASVWLIGAGRGTGANDSFKLSSINVTDVAGAIPEPATWAMMLVGFGGIGAAMRRRRSRVSTNVSYA